MKHIRTLFVIVFGLALYTGLLRAQDELHDPMRPPSDLTSRVNVPVTTVTPDTIQILVVGKHRSFAMIDGVVVKPGDMFYEWQLISIGDQRVEMRHASVTKEISLTPAVVKTVRSTQPSRKLP